MNQEQRTSGRWSECVENGETEVQGGWNAVGAESEACEAWRVLGLGDARTDVGAAIDHPLLDLEDEARAVAARRVADGHLLVQGGRHEGRLDAALDAELVGLPELLGEHAA